MSCKCSTEVNLFSIVDLLGGGAGVLLSLSQQFLWAPLSAETGGTRTHKDALVSAHGTCILMWKWVQSSTRAKSGKITDYDKSKEGTK